jgi:hypothetical protein
MTADPLVFTIQDSPGKGRRFSRLPGGVVKVEFVEFVESELRPGSGVPCLWPPQPWFDRVIAEAALMAQRRRRQTRLSK